MSNIVVSGSIISRLVKGQSTNSTTAAFLVASSRPTTTEPVASATRTVIPAKGTPYKEGVTLKVTPFGGDTNNDVINIKIVGWNSVPSSTLPVLYVPHIICEVAATLSSVLPGIAGSSVVATEFFADEIAQPTQGIGVVHNGAADIDVAWFECDVSSYEYVEVLYSMGAGGNQANCLYRF